MGQTIVFCGLPACGAGARSSHPEGESAEQLKVAALKRLSGDSRSRTAGFRVKTLQGSAGEKRLRVGDFRVRFSEEGGDTLRIHAVKNRKDAYR